MNGARFLHDELVAHGWEVLIADAQRVKGLAPLRTAWCCGKAASRGHRPPVRTTCERGVRAGRRRPQSRTKRARVAAGAGTTARAEWRLEIESARAGSHATRRYDGPWAGVC
jgi:hypothetical protein